VSVYDALARARARGQRVALVTVLDKTAAASSTTGAKLVVGEDGPIEGSLGCSEFDAAGAALAAEALRDGGPIRRRISFGGHSPDLRSEDGRPEQPRDLRSEDRGVEDRGVEERAIEVFAEVHEPEPAVLVLGANPVGRAVAAQARLVGRRVTLVDPGGTTDVAPGVEVKADDPERYLLAAPPGQDDAVVLSDHDAPYVDAVLRIALASPARFVGMLGSRRHAPDAVRRLRASGTPEAHLARLRAPVGLDIGGRAPAEVALSIVAEIVAVEHGRTGGRMGLDWSAQP
jgi:xanthine dehydrogenase accessory factor